MKHHKYFNTIWSERDQEFWWSGMKGGFIIATILTSALWIDGITFVRWIKEERDDWKKES